MADLKLSGSYSLYNNPFVKKKPTDLYLDQQNSNTSKIKLSNETLNKANNPYGFTSGSNVVDLSPTNILPKKDNSTPINYVAPPTTTPKIDTTPTVKTPSAYETYLNNISKLGEQGKQRANERYLSDVQYNTEATNQANKDLQDSIAPVASNLEAFKKYTGESATRQKANAEDVWGTTQRQTAKTRAESEARNRNKYAGLNTLDSFGAGSYGAAQENVESDFNRVTQEGLQSKADKLYNIDAKAESDISAEVQKYNDFVAKVNSSINLNNATKTKLIRDAKIAAEDKIAEIDNYSSELKYKQASESENLSPEFIATGIPKTSADFIFKAKNPSGFETKIGAGTDNNQAKQSILDTIGSIEKGNIGGITGGIQYGFIPGSKAALTKNYYDQLKGMLSLENRSKLKGSGAISDFEAKTLEKAASALGRNLSEDQFKQVLGELKTSLGGSSAVQTIRVKDLKTGQTGTLPANEFDPALYQQI
jgi:hypothetical protein